MKIRRKFITFILGCLVVFFSIGFYQNILTITSLQKEKNINEKKLVELAKKTDQLNKQVNKLNDPQGQLDAAREEYNYLKNGEVKLDFNKDSKK